MIKSKTKNNTMAHNLEIRNGKASIAYAGETPWHRLGQKLDKAFDSKTALEQGGLDFTVTKTPLATADDGIVIPNRFALRRDDTKDVLGVCTGFYQPLQNTEAFSFFDGVFGKDQARYEVAGVLGKGERVWLLAKLPGDFKVGNDDPIGKWLLLTNGHDTNEPVRARFTPIRVVCQNTLNAALGGSIESEIRVQHIGDVAQKLEIAGKLMKAAGIYFNEIQESFQGFARRSLSSRAFTNYVTIVIAGEPTKRDELTAPARKVIDRITELHETGRGHDIKGVRGSLWGAYNAVTEYVDHDKGSKDLGFMGFGRGSKIKERAFTVAKELALAAN